MLDFLRPIPMLMFKNNKRSVIQCLNVKDYCQKTEHLKKRILKKNRIEKSYKNLN